MRCVDLDLERRIGTQIGDKPMRKAAGLAWAARAQADGAPYLRELAAQGSAAPLALPAWRSPVPAAGARRWRRYRRRAIRQRRRESRVRWLGRTAAAAVLVPRSR